MLIALKSVETSITTAQARRLRCVHCRTPYTVLAIDGLASKQHGVPILSSTASLRRLAHEGMLEDARERLLERRGEGPCPTCGHLQPYMGGGGLLHATISTIVLLPTPALLCFLAAQRPLSSTTAFAVFLACATAIWCVAWARAAAHDRASLDPERSLTDADLARVLERLGSTGPDLPTFWARHLKLEEGDTPLVGLGLVDEIGDLEVPPALDPRACLATLERRLRAEGA